MSSSSFHIADGTPISRNGESLLPSNSHSRTISTIRSRGTEAIKGLQASGRTTALLAVCAGCVLLTILSLGAGYRYLASKEDAVSIAFLGNSLQFVNDLPRVMEALHGDGKLYQDSTFHGSVGLGSLYQKGNGMYYRWKKSAVNEDGFRDYGACTVVQLLQGYDEALSYPKDNDDAADDDGADDGAAHDDTADDDNDFVYANDGLNPCFKDESYLEYATEIRAALLASSTTGRASSSSSPPSLHWDFVVLNDQSLRPAIYTKRRRTAASLLRDYVPLFLATDSTPVLYMTWGYWRDAVDMTQYVDVPTLTSLLYEGYLYYAQVLQEALPESRKPRVAPIGLAFLVVWEENHSFWERLFAEDQYHPTPLGTYLSACVVYATIHRRLPPSSSRFTEPLFNRSRAMHLSGHQEQPLPTEEEALYLRWIAKRVALHGYIPTSLVSLSDD
jgi:hypothetical protein